MSKFQPSLIKQHWKLISGKRSKPLIPVQYKWKWFIVYYYPCGPEPEVSVKRVGRTFCHLVKDYTLGMGCLHPTRLNGLEDREEKDTWSKL